MHKWQIRFEQDTYKQFCKLDKTAQQRIDRFLRHKLLSRENPRSLGKPLRGNLGDFWRYRVGDYRLICEIIDHEITILVIGFGHRKDIYTQH